MKYIRTKDGIYKSKRKCIEKDCLVIGEKESGKLGLVRKEIIAQADTIEELCDDFIAFESGFLRPKLEFKNVAKSVLETFIYYVKIECPNADLYGAIWTNKGLIYVAKINKKGELKLL